MKISDSNIGEEGGQRMVNQLKTGDRQGSTHSSSDVQPIIHLNTLISLLISKQFSKKETKINQGEEV